MENITDDRRPLTAGFLSLPSGETRGFNIFVLESRLWLEIMDWATYTYTAPMFLLKDAKARGYRLPTEAIRAIERFAQSGARVISAMVESIKAEMRHLALRPETQRRWLTEPEERIWRLVKAHVPDDLQFAVFSMLRKYRQNFDDEGKIVVKQRSEL